MELTPDLLLRAYAHGAFPMAEGRDRDHIHWVDPKQRGILPLDSFHLPRRLARTVRQGHIAVRCDTDFGAVIAACAAPGPDRPDSWINAEIVGLYTQLFELGYVHTVECWRDDTLVGGLYGVAMAGAFFGESMFSRERDASKIALAHLVLRLRLGGFRLLDTQFITEHLSQFGVIEIPRARYRNLLRDALAVSANFYCEVSVEELLAFTQSSTHKS
jgi:leucyl/phenylalanyl-tRNA--protein transferase